MPAKASKKPAVRGRNKSTRAKKPAGAKTEASLKEKDLIFALDIGTRSVIGIVCRKEGEKLLVLDQEQMEHPGRAMIDGQVEDIQQVAKLVKQVKETLEGRMKVKLKKVAVAAAGRMLRTVSVRVDRAFDPQSPITHENVIGLEGEAIEKAQAQMEAESSTNANQIAFYCVGYNIARHLMDGEPTINLVGHSCSTASIEMIAAFLPRSVVEGLYASVDENALEVGSLTLEPIAAIHVLFPRELWLLNLILVDIGAGTSDIAVCREGAISAFDMATIAGDEVTEELVRKYLITFETAERLKRSLSDPDGAEELSYTNIIGMDVTLKKADLLATVTPVVDLLAKTVAKRILSVNGTKPDALFLIGGSSRLPGLREAMAMHLEMDENKIAVGARTTIKDFEGITPAMAGPEYITPLGIALSAVRQNSFYFFGVTINGHRIKLLNASAMRMMDVLLMGGYKATQVMGRSGRSLRYTLNGESRVLPGGIAAPALLQLNGEEANVESLVEPGDVIEFTPTVNGANAEAYLGDVVLNMASDFVTVLGKQCPLGLTVLKDGRWLTKQYPIQQGDRFVTATIATLADVLSLLGENEQGGIYACGEDIIEPTMLLMPGMDIHKLD